VVTLRPAELTAAVSFTATPVFTEALEVVRAVVVAAGGGGVEVEDPPPPEQLTTRLDATNRIARKKNENGRRITISIFSMAAP
jgi:hypothetical protein